MSLFIDVPEVLSDKIKAGLLEVIENEKKEQDRPVRKICEVCSKYLDYGELRYDRMEDGIAELQKTGIPGNALHVMLVAILNESLDEDLTALNYFAEFSGSSLAGSFRPELSDFITIGRFVTLKEYDMLENAGTIMIERYTDEDNVTDTISNLYLKAENEEYVPVFQRLLNRAKELYPSDLSLESLNGFMNMKGKDYPKALESFLGIKDKMEQDRDNKNYHFNLALTWNNIADCYLKQGDLAKTIESCDIALTHDEKAEDYKVGNAILYKKAEALILLGDNDQALAIATRLLSEDPDDEIALELKNKITL